MKKLTKILIALCLLFEVFSLSVNAEEKPFDYDESELIEYSQNIFNQILTYNENGLEYAVKSSTGTAKDVYETYLQYVKNDTLGQFVEYSKSDIKIEDESVIVNLTAKFEKTDLKVSVTFQDLGTGIGAVNISLSAEEKEKSIAENLRNAASNTVMGLVTVVIMLLFISFIISRFKYIAIIQEKIAAKKALKAGASADAIENAVEQIQTREELVGDTELVAVITAAICAATNKSGDSFVVRSIRKRK